MKNSKFNAIPKQAKRLEERHGNNYIETNVCGINIIVDPGVYQTSGDSELMIDSVTISKNQNFIEIGCGTGVVSIALSKKAKEGVSVDINEKAVLNAKKNAINNNINNVDFFISNVFENVKGVFDFIVCNPPYTKHEVRDNVDRMFWDPEDEMKRTFFKEVGGYLKQGGKIYFGWADFADIDIELPLKLAEENGFVLINTFKKPHKDDFNFYVFEFARKI